MGKLINSIRTSSAALGLLCRFSGLLNLFARRFDGKRNCAVREAITLPDGCLNGQRLSPLCSIPYGAYTVGWCGCEAIAVYNLLLTVGKERPFYEVAQELESGGLLLNGLGGTHIPAALRFLECAGVRTENLNARRAADYDAAFEDARGAILAYWTGAPLKNPDGRWNMLHTVALAHAPGGVIFYNAETGSREPAYAPDIDDFLRRGGFLPVMLCTAK